VARAATTSDAFNAIAEPQRREILVAAAGGERPVTELARDLGMTSRRRPSTCGCSARSGSCGSAGRASSGCTAWTPAGCGRSTSGLGGFERFWSESFDRLDEYVQELKQARQEDHTMATTSSGGEPDTRPRTARS
jgi:hypothetical protein